MIKKVFKWALYLLLFGVVAGLAFYFSIYLGIWTTIQTREQLAEIRQSEATEIYAEGGELVGKYYIFDRQPITYEEIPQHLIEALMPPKMCGFSSTMV